MKNIGSRTGWVIDLAFVHCIYQGNWCRRYDDKRGDGKAYNYAQINLYMFVVLWITLFEAYIQRFLRSPPNPFLA